MKMNVEIECSPQEARTLMGLPDLEPMQTAVLAHFEKRLIEATSVISPEGMLKTWFALVPGSDSYLKMMTNFMTAAVTSTDARDA